MTKSTITTRSALAADISDILNLQTLNLYANLSAAQRVAGFVTTPFQAEQVNTLIEQSGAFVAEQAGVLVGYALVGSWDFFAQWPIFPYMMSRFPLLEFQGSKITIENSFQYGPVCIDRAVRGSNALPLLFDTMKSSLASRYPLGVTFINKQNPRSLAAHTRKLNLEVIDEFEFNGSEFYGLAFSTK
jgi:hypothetical protein